MRAIVKLLAALMLLLVLFACAHVAHLALGEIGARAAILIVGGIVILALLAYGMARAK